MTAASTAYSGDPVAVVGNGPVGQTAARPGLFGGMFGGGLLGGLAAGFLGAGLFGLLFGHGLFGGMAGFASIIGIVLQVALIVIVARLAFAWWQRRNAPAYAAATPSPAGGTTQNFTGFGGALGGASAPAASWISNDPVPECFSVVLTAGVVAKSYQPRPANDVLSNASVNRVVGAGGGAGGGGRTATSR